MKYFERLSTNKKHLNASKRRRLLPFVMILLTATLLAILIGCCIYVNDYYRADETAQAALVSSESVTVDIQDSRVVFAPADIAPAVGFIFYPGGKVEHTAYAPLLQELAENGVLCVLVEMPLRLAVLNMDAADGIPEEFAEKFPKIEGWYIGGHSLGGSMAASYAAEASDDASSKTTGAADGEAGAAGGTVTGDAAGSETAGAAGNAAFSGLALLASYSTADLTASGLQVFSLYGTKDQVLNLEKYEEYHGNLPANTTEILIDGGNHAQFGSYGAQKGDGEAEISAEEQLEITVQHLLEFFGL